MALNGGTRERFGSRAGFVMAAVGSAIGLDNMWRSLPERARKSTAKPWMEAVEGYRCRSRAARPRAGPATGARLYIGGVTFSMLLASIPSDARWEHRPSCSAGVTHPLMLQRTVADFWRSNRSSGPRHCLSSYGSTGSRSFRLGRVDRLRNPLPPELGSNNSGGAYLIVAPIKIEGGSGGQVWIFAVVS